MGVSTFSIDNNQNFFDDDFWKLQMNHKNETSRLNKINL